MRYSLLAGGKRIRPVLALATARAIGREAGRGPAARRRHRAHPHLLAHPRRPAGDGRRRPAPRPPDEPQGVRRGRRDPRGRRALRRGVPPRPAPPARGEPQRRARARVAELAAATGVNGMVGGQCSTSTGAATASTLRRLHELKTGRLIGASVECVLPRRHGLPSDNGLSRASPTSWASSSRSSTTSSTSRAPTTPSASRSGSDERHGKRTYVSEFGLEGARTLARSPTAGRARPSRRPPPDGGAAELEQITDFICTRTS